MIKNIIRIQHSDNLLHKLHKLYIVVCVNLAAAHATMSSGQDATPAFATRTEVATATRDAAGLALQLEDQLRGSFPAIPGWVCEAPPESERQLTGPARALPIVTLACSKDARQIDMTLFIDKSMADYACQRFDVLKSQVADGRISAGLYRFFETGNWRLSLGGPSLKGCVPGALSIEVRWSNWDSETNAGEAISEEIAEAILAVDASELAASQLYSRQQAALRELLRQLETQTDALQSLLPGIATRDISEIKDYEAEARRRAREGLETEMPERIAVLYERMADGWHNLIGRTPGQPGVLMSTSIQDLTRAPFVVAGLTTEHCTVSVQLSAGLRDPKMHSPTAAFATDLEGEDGAISGEYIIRKTERFVGRERVDGAKIEALFHDRLLVRIERIGRQDSCADQPQVVSEVFATITQNDLSAFGLE